MPFQTFALLDTLKHVEIAGHQQCGSLEIFHLRWPAGDGLTYSTLDEALEAASGDVRRTWSLGVQQLSIFEPAHLVALCSSSHDDEAGFTKLSLCRCADL